MLRILSSSRLGERALQIANNAYIRSAVLLIWSETFRHYLDIGWVVNVPGRTGNFLYDIAASEG